MDRSYFTNYVYELNDIYSIAVIEEEYNNILFKKKIEEDEILIECKSGMTSVFFPININEINNIKENDDILEKYKKIKEFKNKENIFDILGYNGYNFLDWLIFYKENSNKINNLICKTAYVNGLNMIYKMISADSNLTK